VRRETQNVLLLLLGGALLKISINGQYVRYVKPSLQPWLIACGAVAVVLALISIVRDLRVPRDARHQDHDHQHDHQHSSRSPWLLMLPVLAIFLVAPPALGSDKVARSGDRSVAAQAPGNQTNVDFVELPEGEAPLLTIADAVTRAIWDDSGSLDGRQIRLVGFVTKGTDGSTYLTRLVIGCCAADATPVKVKLDGGDLAQAGQYPPDTWLEVRGEIESGTANEANGYAPNFVVSQVTPVEAPANPYEF
jgi:uncharacterized repeat protein (TIGR03943 family)